MNKYSDTKQPKNSGGNSLPGKKKIGKFFLRLLGVFLILTMVGYLSWYAWLKINTAEYFSVNHLDCSPTQRIERSRILEVIEGSKGKSIFRVDVNRLAELIDDFRWIKEAVVYRVLPDTLEIEIKERVPSAVAVVESKKYLVGEDGTVIKQIAGNPFDVPFIYPSVERNNTSIGDIMNALNLLKKRVPDFYTHIEKIKPGDQRLGVYLDNRPEIMYLNPDEPTVNIRRFQSVEKILHKEYTSIEYIDLRWEKQIYIKGERL